MRIYTETSPTYWAGSHAARVAHLVNEATLGTCEPSNAHRARSGRAVYRAALLVCNTDTLHHQRFGQSLARALHAPGRVQAHDDGSPGGGGLAGPAARVAARQRGVLLPPSQLVRVQAALRQLGQQQSLRPAALGQRRSSRSHAQVLDW